MMAKSSLIIVLDFTVIRAISQCSQCLNFVDLIVYISYGLPVSILSAEYNQVFFL